MRTWRFNEHGHAIDAVVFKDTFVLGPAEDFSPAMKNREDYKKLKHFVGDTFDYACRWKHKIFPVYDSEMRSLQKMELAIKDREKTGLVFKV